MVQTALDWLIAWVPLLALCSLPWLVQLTVALAQMVYQRQLLRQDGDLLESARRWLERAVQRQGLRTGIEVHEALGEGYFPQSDTVGLSPRAAESAHPVHRAVVAHELGHAANTGLHPSFRAAAPIARLAADALPHLFAAALLIGALQSASWLVHMSVAVAALAGLAHGLVLLDETAASWRAWTWLHHDRSLTEQDLQIARSSMLGALASYAAPVIAWTQVAVTSWWWLPYAISVDSAPVVPSAYITGTWLFVFFVPVLMLQAGYVVLSVVKPEPVRSSFRLEMVAQRDNQWSFIAGLCVALLVICLHGHMSGLGWTIVLVLAAFVAVGPASVMARIFVLLPALAIGNLLGLTEKLGAIWPDHEPDDKEGPAAVVALFEHPPWYLRGGKLLQLAWVPFAAMVIIDAMGRQ